MRHNCTCVIKYNINKYIKWSSKKSISEKYIKKASESTSAVRMLRISLFSCECNKNEIINVSTLQFEVLINIKYKSKLYE